MVDTLAMSNTAATPSPSPSAVFASQPSATPPAVEPVASEAVTLEQVEQAIREGDSEQLGALMAATHQHKPAAVQVEPEPAAEPEAQPEATPETPASEKPVAIPENPEADPQPEPADEPGKPKQYRIRGRDAKEDQFLALVRGGKTVPEATAEIYGKVEPVKADAKPTDEKPVAPVAEDPAAKLDSRISAIDSEIKDLREKARKAGEDMEMGDVLRLTEEISDKKLELFRAQQAKETLAARQQETAETAAKSAEKADFQNVVVNYPELGQKGSPERAKFDAFVNERSNHPDYDGIFASSKWRSILAREWAELEGVVPAKHRQATPPVAPAQEQQPAKNSVPPAQPSRPRAPAANVVGARDNPGAARSSFEQTPEDIAGFIEGLTDPKEIERLMNEIHRLQKASPAARR